MRLTFLPLVLASCWPASPRESGSGPPFPEEELPALLLAMSDFKTDEAGSPVLQPARTELLRFHEDRLQSTSFRDQHSTVFHKAIFWRGGVLTIGGDGARVVHWSSADGAMEPHVLFEARFGGEHDRIRDLELGDVTGDGLEEIVIATHDQGIIGVGQESEAGWSWTELGRRPRTFVHEIELGDLDGDGVLEIYATPSEPNRSTGEAQPGGVERWLFREQVFVREPLVSWTQTHAKEILIADLGDGPWLFAVKEGVSDAGGGLSVPVQVVRLDLDEKGWTEHPVATLYGERQSRFLVAGDLEGSGTPSLVATGMKTGVWRIDRRGDTFIPRQIDSGSGGFEQAALIADLDQDGRSELYVMSEAPGKPRVLHRYDWGDGSMRRRRIFEIEGAGIVWGLDAGTFPGL
ncbi:MAG: VCBS repeat-containing protein [Deltaproteobacteria bacterium]|nr:MAG: VCBS repeat-containing protein [Deltaproteobacteria bacterium]